MLLHTHTHTQTDRQTDKHTLQTPTPLGAPRTTSRGTLPHVHDTPAALGLSDLIMSTSSWFLCACARVYVGVYNTYM
jgi:hypothetical protein